MSDKYHRLAFLTGELKLTLGFFLLVFLLTFTNVGQIAGSILGNWVDDYTINIVRSTFISVTLLFTGFLLLYLLKTKYNYEY